MVLWIHFGYPLPRFSRPGGPGLLTISRRNDFELYRPARRAGLDPLTTTPEGVSATRTTLLYWRRRVKSAGNQKGKQNHDRNSL